MKHLAILLIRGYQRLIGPMLPRTCKFEPSCSVYAIEAFRKKGFFRGVALTTWRLLRCNPWGRGGYDPVERAGHASEEARKAEHEHGETA
jgi:hypothetical protein